MTPRFGGFAPTIASGLVSQHLVHVQQNNIVKSQQLELHNQPARVTDGEGDSLL
jgi:hypothetical protein